MQILVDHVSMSGNITSDTLIVAHHEYANVQCSWSGTPTGTINIQISNDGIIWDTLTGSSVTLSGTADHKTIGLNFMGYPMAKAVYTFSSGSGTLYITANVKGWVL